MTSKVDLLVVVYNCKHLIPLFVASLRNISIPVTVYFLDNGSRDGTADAVAQAISELPFEAYCLRSLRNNGFARGMNLLSRQGKGDFLFLLNPDTEIEPGCLERLLARAESDARIGICEARQTPREHPKAVDGATGETTWCSGAAALIRRDAFEEAGTFDEMLYFMYCEDVDLSWKMWLKGWKCIYVPDALVHHYTQDLMPGKRRMRENYFSFRNSLFLFYRFGSWAERGVLKNFLWKRFLSSAYSVRSKVLFAIAFIEHIRYIPYLLQNRKTWSDRKHDWIRLEETSLAN
ncbi:MAG TPA: glycosyltransferase family 2 protein [Terriglobia bacterium]|nr:glycosyltransferase family 2 protein [Terriglobia bacterium]